MTTRHDPIDIVLIDRYLAGECTPDEMAMVQQWVGRSPENARLLDALRAAFHVSTEEPPASDAQAVWDRTAARLSATEAPTAAPVVVPFRLVSAVTPQPRWARRVRDAGRLAAAVVLAAGGGLLVWHSQRVKQPPVPAPAGGKEYVAQRGQRAELQLLDGTRVILAPGSRLSIPAGYEMSRMVALEGEALFDVAHRGSPFVVHAGSAVVRDIGTRFDVRAFTSEITVRVVVSLGAVRLAPRTIASDSGPLLTAGDIGQVGPTGPAQVLRRHVNVGPLLAWTKGTIVFDRTPMRSALSELARWFDVDFRVVGSARDSRTLTATLQDPSIADVLHLLGVSLEMRVERQGGLITLYPDQ